MSQNSGSPAKPDQILRYFKFDHLPPALQKISRIFAEAAAKVTLACPSSAERTASYRKLLEAKDCAVRACVLEDSAFESAWSAYLAEISAEGAQ